jgi:hypothetical protein
MGWINATRILLAADPTKPRELKRKASIELTMPIIIPNSKSKPSVFSHRQCTSKRLRERLSSAPLFSIIITGITREYITAKIMPGITNAISPKRTRMPMIMLTAKSDSNRDMVKLKLAMRFAVLFSSVSEVNFMAIP